jgi:predicted Fe-S protein YdhL (DUF1289 family)
VKKILWFALLAGISGALASVLTDPASPLRGNGSHAPILVSAHADQNVLTIIERSCQNCHSSNTEWPLYSRIVPFSWMIEHDVRTARAHMDLSRWQTYDDAEKRRILSEIGSVVRGHIMPPRRYTMVHPGAKLSEREADEIYRWTRADRKLLSRE